MIYAASTYSKTLSNNTHFSVSDQSSSTGKAQRERFAKHLILHPSSSGKERDEETGLGYFGARYMDQELMTMWLSVDPMADKYPSISPYAYCAWSPMKLVDPEGKEITDFQDKNGKLIMHVEDGSNAVFRLKGQALTDEYFAFQEYNNQGGADNVSMTGLIAGAQEYVLDHHIYCNQAVNFVGRTFSYACETEGYVVKGSSAVTGNLCADPIINALREEGLSFYEKNSTNITTIQQEASNGAFVVGVKKGHVSMVSTLTYGITKYNKDKSTYRESKGGLTVNINGSTRSGMGPSHNNDMYSLISAYADGWFVMKPSAIRLTPVVVNSNASLNK